MNAEKPSIKELSHWSVNSISRYCDAVRKEWSEADKNALQISARLELVNLIRAVVEEEMQRKTEGIES